MIALVIAAFGPVSQKTFQLFRRSPASAALSRWRRACRSMASAVTIDDAQDQL
jgi:hypothetical protein